MPQLNYAGAIFVHPKDASNLTSTHGLVSPWSLIKLFQVFMGVTYLLLEPDLQIKFEANSIKNAFCRADLSSQHLSRLGHSHRPRKKKLFPQTDEEYKYPRSTKRISR